MSGRKIMKTIKKICSFLKGLLTFHISTIVFGALFLYMIVTVILYATSSHVTSYQVTVGPLTKNPVCTALVLREEQVIQAKGTGYVDYYAREGMQVRKDGLVYGLDNQQQTSESPELSADQTEEIRADIAKFSYNFDGNNFFDTYSFKYELQGSILQNSGAKDYIEAQGELGLEESSDLPEGEDSEEDATKPEPQTAISLGSQRLYTAPQAGVVVYAKDGYEGKTPENLTEEDFDQKSYKKTDLLTSEEVEPGDDVYKVITSEDWTLMVPVSDKLAATLADKGTVKVQFHKDGETQNGSISVITIGNQKVAKIDLQNGMVRYAADRFLEIELVINTQSGLKIPVSSIVTKEFYLVPREFLTQGDNGTSKGFLRKTQNGEEVSTEFVDAVIYRETDAQGKEIDASASGDSGGSCYVDKQTLSEGDVLQKPDSGETFTVGEIDYLEGVYCINQGYAVFRQIQLLDQNEEYCIVAENTRYGLEPFDSIVLDGETVKEEDILY